jgi:Domain of unknown function (DUF5655)
VNASARGKGLSKSKTTKKSKPPAKSSPPATSHYDPWNVKGSVTRHLEAKAGTTYTEARLIDGLDEDLRDAWHKLRAFAAGLGPQRIYASPLSIMFARKVCYFFVRPRKTFLEVWFFLPRKIKGLRSMHGPTKKVKHCILFKVVHPDQIEEPLTDWIREAFDFAPELGRS